MTIIAAILPIVADMRETRQAWISEGCDGGDAISAVDGYVHELTAAIEGAPYAGDPTYPVVLALAALPTSTPALMALDGMMPCIRKDEASRLAAADMLDAFLARYGGADEAERASTEEGDAFALAFGLLADLDADRAGRFDPAFAVAIASGASVEVALDHHERRVHQELAERAAPQATSTENADERRVRDEYADMAAAR
jgi:hypothetical protein